MSELAEMKVILEQLLKTVKGKMNSDLDEGESEQMPESPEGSVEMPEMEESEESCEDDPMAEIEADQKKYFSNDKPKEEKKGGFRGGFGGMSEPSSNPFKKRGK